MAIKDLGISKEKIADSARNLIDRAESYAKRKDHARLTNEHIFLAYMQIEWDLFSGFMRTLNVNPHNILQDFDRYMDDLETKSFDFDISDNARRTLRVALYNVSKSSRRYVEDLDIITAILEDEYSVIADIFRRRGANTLVLVSIMGSYKADTESRIEKLKKQHELPPFLKHFATNLNFLAHQDKLPPVFGREEEINRVIEILCHRERSNSVMLIGEPGVGKTAIAEGLARRLALNPDSIPIRIRNCQVVNLQMNTLVAGTMLRGMFEDRMQSVIKELKENTHFILFVDEAHTLVGAGSALGAPSDAANILKSVLARGEIRMIAATTLSEYKEYIQEDEALARRFRVVNVLEPSIDETRNILYSLRPRLQRNYSVELSDPIIELALELSPRYMRHLFLPDKVIGWLDTSCVKCGNDQRIQVTEKDLIATISDSSQIPEDVVARDISESFDNIEEELSKRVIGQKEAIKAVADRFRLNKSVLKDGITRPDGVLLFLGPTGVGKTELVKALTEFLFDDEGRMIRIDMSEYPEGSANVDKLIGQPRGIVGSERGGILTNKVKDQPYSVILLDEVEKAAPSLLNLFLQAFDEGWLTDGRGRRVYLSDAFIVMTSNLGSEHFKKITSPLGFATGKSEANIASINLEVLKEVERRFSPEFRNRIDEVIVFSPLTHEEVREIAKNYIRDIQKALVKKKKYLIVDDDALDQLVADGYNLAYGARYLKKQIIDRKIKMPISNMFKKSSHFHAVLRNSQVEIETNGIENGILDADVQIA